MTAELKNNPGTMNAPASPKQQKLISLASAVKFEESTEYQDYVDYESLLDEMYSHYLAQANGELLQIDVSC